MNSQHYLKDTLLQLRKYKIMAEKAMAQISDDDFFTELSDIDNSLAIIVKHMAGNMRSRWRDFLTSDGEKDDRHRDTEFEIYDSDSKESLMQKWEDGWQLCFEAIELLIPEDLEKTIYIRAEAHSVLEAINRQLTHYAYHVGQIVYLSRHFAGTNWKSLGIPKGESDSYDVSKDGKVRKE